MSKTIVKKVFCSSLLYVGLLEPLSPKYYFHTLLLPDFPPIYLVQLGTTQDKNLLNLIKNMS